MTFVPLVSGFSHNLGDQFEDAGPEIEEALGARKTLAQASLRRWSSMGVKSSAPPSHLSSTQASLDPESSFLSRVEMTSQELRGGEKVLNSPLLQQTILSIF